MTKSAVSGMMNGKKTKMGTTAVYEVNSAGTASEVDENDEEFDAALEKVTRRSMSPTDKEMVDWIQDLIGFVPHSEEKMAELRAQRHPDDEDDVPKYSVEIETIPEAICRLFTGTTFRVRGENRATSQSGSNNDGQKSPDSAGSAAEKENSSAGVNAKNKKSKRSSRKKAQQQQAKAEQKSGKEDKSETERFHHESVLEEVEKLEDTDLIRFFDFLHNMLLRHSIPGESCEDLSLRRSEHSHDLRVAFSRWRDGTTKSLDETFEKANAQFRSKQYRAANMSFNDAVFHAMIRPYSPLFPWYGKDAESDAESDSGSTASSCGELSKAERRPRPYHYAYFDLRYRQVECLIQSKTYRKASLYGFELLQWMGKTVVDGMKGYFATKYPVQYSLVQMWVGEAEVSMNRYTEAVEKCTVAIQHILALESNAVLDRDLYNGRKIMFERMKEYFEEDGAQANEIQADRERAAVIVDENAVQGFRNKGFYVNDLYTALRIVKDGQAIFLEPGTYAPSAESPGDNKKESGKKAKKPVFEFRKSIEIIGASTSRSIISGSFVKWGAGELRFKRLKLEIGLDIDANDDAYFMEGKTVLTNVVIESPVNTAMYVISPSVLHTTEVTFRNCIFDGLENCRRMIAFEGLRPTIKVESCYASDLFSFITVINAEEVTSAVVAVLNSVFVELQDGLKMIVHHGSNISASVAGCHLELLQYTPDVPSHGFSLTGGSAKVYGNLIYCQNVDSVGLSLHSLRKAEIDVNLVESSSESPRQMALGQGIVISDSLVVHLSSTEVVGMRVGFQLSNSYPEHNEVVVRDCSSKQCSLGFHIKGTATAEEIAEDPTARNLESTLIETHFASCFNGVLCDDPRSKLELYGCSFYDVVKPIIVLQSSLHQLKISSTEFRRTRDYSAVDVEIDPAAAQAMTAAEVEEKKMTFHLAQTENLPYQLAIDMASFAQIASQEDEREFARKFKLWREAEIN